MPTGSWKDLQTLSPQNKNNRQTDNRFKTLYLWCNTFFNDAGKGTKEKLTKLRNYSRVGSSVQSKDRVCE